MVPWSPLTWLELVIILAGYVLVIWPGGWLVAALIRRFHIGDFSGNEGLAHAGKYIGYLERILLLTFVLADQFLAIGFLIAAKSIFRFEPENRRFAEYFLIGSLLSFNIAIIIGIVIRAIVW